MNITDPEMSVETLSALGLVPHQVITLTTYFRIAKLSDMNFSPA